MRLLAIVTVLASRIAFADVAAKVDPLFASFNKPNVPGAAVTIIQDGTVLYEKGYGLASFSNKEPVSPETNFRLASLTKQFTAMAIAILTSENKLALDESLQDVFPDFPNYGKRVTIKHLLHHTSGLVSYESLIPSGQSKQVSDSDVLEMMKRQTGTEFTPGSRYRYSNSGYVVLSQVVEKRAGQSFASFVQERIFQPLWMKNSQVYEGSGATITSRAYGHSASGTGFKQTDQSVTSATQGDGGVYTSVKELFYWDQALYGTFLLPASLMTLVFTPGELNDGSSTGYGFGWEIGSYRGLKRYSHTGSSIGFRTAIQRYPEKHFTVAVLINRADTAPWDIARSIVDTLLF